MHPKLTEVFSKILTFRQYLPRRFKLIPTVLSLAAICLLAGGIATYSWLSAAGLFEIDDAKLDLIVNYQHSDNSLVYDK
ncbi:MAG: hypothetical protein EOP10_23185, partial [Proteobacteria bacterium]